MTSAAVHRSRAVRVGWPALTVLVALAALGVALAVGGGATDPNGPATAIQVASPVLALVLTLAASATLGAVLLAALALSPADPRWGRLLDGAAAAAGAWTVAAAGSTFVLYLALGPKPSDPKFGPNFVLYIGSDPGDVWLGVTIAAALLTTLLIAVRSHTGAGLLVPATAAALVPFAQLGHASSAAGDHATATTALALHVIGAAAWLGGLAVLLVLGVPMRGGPLADLAERYSTIALACFVVVGFSGVVSAWIRLPEPAMLLTPYGELVLVKSAALLAAGLLGALHRLVTIPRIRIGEGRGPFLRLVAVELLVLAVAAGFAAGLAATAPPDQVIAPLVTPAQILTGSPLPGPVGLVPLLTTWRLDPLWAVVCGSMGALYLVGVRRLRRQGGAWPAGRTLGWLAGTAVLAWLTNGAPNRYQEVLFSAHMVEHLGLLLLVPLLLVSAAPVTLALEVLPRRVDGTRGSREWLLLAAGSRAAAVLRNPVAAAALLVGSLVAFTWSPLFRWAATDHTGHEWMTTASLVLGCAFVSAVLGPEASLRHRGRVRLLVIGATTAAVAVVGVVLIAGHGLLLSDWYGAMGWGTSALADQHLGGVAALVVGGLPLLVLAAVVAARRGSAEDLRVDLEPAAPDAVLGRVGSGA